MLRLMKSNVPLLNVLHTSLQKSHNLRQLVNLILNAENLM